MPIATTSQPTGESCLFSRLRLPSDSVPKPGNVCEGRTMISQDQAQLGGVEGASSGGGTTTNTIANLTTAPTATTNNNSHSHHHSSSSGNHHHHQGAGGSLVASLSASPSSLHPALLETPRTRSRSRSGFVSPAGTQSQQPPLREGVPGGPGEGQRSSGSGPTATSNPRPAGTARPLAAGVFGASLQCQPIHQEHACNDDGDKSEDSPSPKRQRLSHSVFDYTTASPAPSPPMRPWELTSNRRPPSARPNQHHFSGERCNTPARNRRSPPVRRQRGRRERLTRHNSISQDENYHHLSYGQQPAMEEPRAFHPPNVSPRMLHPAAHPPQQNAVMVDIHEQIHQGTVPVSYTVTTVAPHGIPLCTGQHIPACNTQQVPGCSVVFSGQHLPVCSVPPPMLQACSVQHLPVPYAAFPPLISSDPFILHPPHLSPHHPPHLPPPGQFVPFQTQQSRSPLQRIENEVELLGEHLPVGGFTYPPSAHAPALPPSAPLQFLTHDPLHQEVSFGVPYPPFLPRRLTGRSRYRSQQPIPPPPYHPSLLPYVLRSRK
ncbi:E3 ubiquitin-protein ligase RNF38 isoform X2 [Latimeria chalumnae]|uniref:E3 ubiquitin-protein ligase RNF38 isoform X2 n=1 Tax=Latimeria chalumnae TaxID=7897 RepID=UPI0003C1663A|nr:PREDICTED: E3 ubiquitin-protein ligase RNF38 isoform X2 [Latimeria chalumnae]|eukprot:XP_006008110.1 PREDICTED: E3 ubiquitin-protein ligase RNF38 isoform X2 [Latimeria chalumnae]